MEEQWKFIKSNGGWWLVISDINQLLAWNDATSDKYGKAILPETDNDERYTKVKQLAKILAENKQSSLLEGMASVASLCLESKLNDLVNGYTLYINENGGYNHNMKAEKTIYKKKLIFPEYTKDDIKISQWGKGAGFHYYAHVGDIEVMNGDVMKWDTFQEAYDEAMKYVTEA